LPQVTFMLLAVFLCALLLQPILITAHSKTACKLGIAAFFVRHTVNRYTLGMYKSHTQICVLVFMLLGATAELTNLHAQETITLSEDPTVLETARKTIRDYGIEPTVASVLVQRELES